MSTETRTPRQIAHDAVDAMLTKPNSASTVRDLLVGLMEDTLRLSMKAEWDMEDNFSMTEHVFGTLASALPDITRDEVHCAADEFGLEIEDLDDPYHGIAHDKEN